MYITTPIILLFDIHPRKTRADLYQKSHARIIIATVFKYPQVEATSVFFKNRIVNNMWYIQTIEKYTQWEKHILLIHRTTRMNLKTS